MTLSFEERQVVRSPNTEGRPVFNTAFRARKRGFIPTHLPNCELWLDAALSPLWQDAARTVIVTSDADPVGAWDDLSGNDYHCTQSTDALRPELEMAVGRTALKFTAANSQRLEVPVGGLSIFQNVAGGSLFVAGQSDDQPLAGRQVAGWSTGASTSAGRFAVPQLGLSPGQWRAGIRRLDADAAVTLVGGTFTDGWQVWSAVADYQNSAASASVGGVTFAAATPAWGGKSEDTASLAGRIGCAINDSQFWQGSLAAVIAYSRALSADEARQVSGYLAERYGAPSA